MRPPLRAIEPLMLGVSLSTRALFLSASSRDSVAAIACDCALWPGTGTGPGVLGAPTCALSCPGAGVFWACVWVCCCCCFCICGRPKKYCQPISTTADSTMASRVFF